MSSVICYEFSHNVHLTISRHVFSDQEVGSHSQFQSNDNNNYNNSNNNNNNNI